MDWLTVAAPFTWSTLGGGSRELWRVIAICVLSSRADSPVGLVVLARVTESAAGIARLFAFCMAPVGRLPAANVSRVCHIRLMSCPIESIFCLVFR